MLTQPTITVTKSKSTEQKHESHRHSDYNHHMTVATASSLVSAGISVMIVALCRDPKAHQALTREIAKATPHIMHARTHRRTKHGTLKSPNVRQLDN